VKTECEREQDVLDALAARRWPDRCDEELRTHVATCGTCEDLVIVAAALCDDQESTWREARVPPSSQVWWRAQMRAREEGARAAVRPIAFIQGVAASLALWLVVTAVRTVPLPFPSISDWYARVNEGARALALVVPDVSGIAAAVPGGLVFLLVIGGSLLLAPVAMYFASRN
jgi:hypothetical protein